jgi:hypothetical protein
MAGVKGGSVTDSILDATGGYIKIMLVVAILFGSALMLDLNHVVLNALGNVVGGIATEVPNAADNVREIQAAGPRV